VSTAFNQSIKYVPGLAAVHRTSLTGRRLFQRYLNEEIANAEKIDKFRR